MGKDPWFLRLLLAALLGAPFQARTSPGQIPATQTGAKQTDAKPAAAPGAGATELLDLNTATTVQLKALPGIGDAYARRIVDGRPYSAKNQLVSRGILPQGAYDKIKDGVVAHRGAKR